MMLEYQETKFIGLGLQQAYSLNERDNATISVVKHLLSKKAYGELFTVDNHLLMLDSIRRKLSMICAGESTSGLVNWELKQHITELRDLMDNLRNIRSKLFVSLA